MRNKRHIDIPHVKALLPQLDKCNRSLFGRKRNSEKYLTLQQCYFEEEACFEDKSEVLGQVFHVLEAQQIFWYDLSSKNWTCSKLLAVFQSSHSMPDDNGLLGFYKQALKNRAYPNDTLLVGKQSY